MARVLAISSQVVWGPVGNTAAVPALQAQGHEVMQVPTILLSNHPGHGKPVAQATSPELFQSLLDRITELGALGSCDAVMTGYFASAAQVKIAAKLIAEIKPRFVLVDPVIGDHGKLYVAEDIATAIRDHLLPLATIATPNIFELGWLTACKIDAHDQAIAAARMLNIAEVLVTSVPLLPDMLETLLVTNDAVLATSILRLAQIPHGTGDHLAGLYMGARINWPAGEALTLASASLERAIGISTGRAVLNITG